MSRAEWFVAFLADRGTRKPSPHTMKAYRQDVDAIATARAKRITATVGLSAELLTNPSWPRINGPDHVSDPDVP